MQAILNGRVVQRGDQLTLSLELVDVQTENVLWSQQYVRKQTDLVTLQTEIARDVSSRLRSKLSGADEAKITKTYTTNPEAYPVEKVDPNMNPLRDDARFRKCLQKAGFPE